ncbi:MAG: tetratricopeptide repeat protein [Cytophagales bacterium]|nr:tetratricopeptide repeat protein [Cytophagales bacterium]MDW8383689.1 tetratricopeptide repeat protein [Flammeovirgaceae bacterium]
MKNIAILLSILIGIPLFAQDGWNWGDDPATAKEKNALYTDFQKQGKYAEAVEPLEYLLKNVPKLNRSIYQNGVTIYQNLLLTEKDPAKIIAYQDRILELLDLRMKYFGDEEKVLVYKAQLAYPYLINRKPERHDELYDTYKTIIDKIGTKAGYIAYYYYFVLAQIQFQKKKLSEDEILAIYDQVTSANNALLATETKPEIKKAIEETQVKEDGILEKMVTLDCNYVRKRMADRLTKNPDLETAKKAIKYMTQGEGCVKDPLYLTAVKFVQQKEPSMDIAIKIAKLFGINGELDSTEIWYQKAVELATPTDGERKADCLMELAKLAAKKGQKAKAREYAKQAAEADSKSASEAYSFIGNLYLGSGPDCVSPGDPVKSRAVYLAAYDMFQRAGNTAGMKAAEAQFPSMEDIFTQGRNLGETIEIGCWVGGTSTLRRRP